MHLSAFFYRQKQNRTFTDFVRPTALVFFRSIVPIAADGPTATYFFTAQAEQVKSDKPKRSHLVIPCLNSRKQCAFPPSHRGSRSFPFYVSKHTGSMTFLLKSRTVFSFFQLFSPRNSQILLYSFESSSDLYCPSSVSKTQNPTQLHRNALHITVLPAQFCY